MAAKCERIHNGKECGGEIITISIPWAGRPIEYTVCGKCGCLPVSEFQLVLVSRPTRGEDLHV